MATDQTIISLSVTTTNRDRGYWASRQGLSSEVISKIKMANFLFVPWEDRGNLSHSFPDGAAEVIKQFSSFFGTEKVGIAIEKHEYHEVALHSRKIRLPWVLVSTLFFPALANILAAEFEKKWKEKTESPKVEFRVIVHNEQGACISVDYDGPSDRLTEILVREVERCFEIYPKPDKQIIAPLNKSNSKKRPKRTK